MESSGFIPLWLQEILCSKEKMPNFRVFEESALFATCLAGSEHFCQHFTLQEALSKNIKNETLLKETKNEHLYGFSNGQLFGINFCGKDPKNGLHEEHVFSEIVKNGTHLECSKNRPPDSRLSDGHYRIAFFRDGPFLDSPHSGFTGAVTSILGMINALANVGFEIYLFYCFRGWSNPEFYKKQKLSTIFIRPEDFYANKSLVSRLIQKYSIDIGHFDSAEATYLQTNFVKPQAKVVFEVHNVESCLMEKNGANSKSIDYMKTRETRAIEVSDLVLVRSKQDLVNMLQLSPKEHHMKLKLYRGCVAFKDVSIVPRPLSKNLIFIGNLFYSPNLESLEIIASEIAPHVSSDIYIVGKCATLTRNKYKHLENMIFLNWQETLGQVFENVGIGIAPIVSGSGTSLKVLDYMAHHVPVVATNLAIRGLEEELQGELIIEDNIGKYSEIIEKLLKDPESMQSLARKGCGYVRKYRDWKVGVVDVIKVRTRIC